MSSNNIYLTGFMGAGKSRVGRLLAQKLSRKFVDTDHLIEEQQGQSIKSIFEEKGEEYFRNLETELLKELSQQSGLIVSTGGGLPMKIENQDIMNQAYCVFIETSFEIMLERIFRNDKRPLAKTPEQVQELYEARLPLYKKAKYSVVHSLDPDATCQKIMALLRKK